MSSPCRRLVVGLAVCGSTMVVAASSRSTLAPVDAPASARQGTQAPDTRPAFRTGVELVQLDVSVLDRRRQPIADLTAADFTIFENGVQRPVRGFSRIALPARSRDAADVVAPARDTGVATNRIGEQEGRLVVILMDRSIPTEQATFSARKIALAAVDALGPNDLAAVVATSPGTPQNFTADRDRLIAAITQRDWSVRLSPEQEAIIGKEDPLADGRCLCGVCVLDTVTRVAEALRHAPRRRKLLLFIGTRAIFQSGPRDPSADPGCGRHLRDARQRMTDAIALSSVTVHSIDPAGIVNIGGHTRAGVPNKPLAGQQNRSLTQLADVGSYLGEQNSLLVLPDLTGGRAVLNTNAPELDVPEIFDETGTYYVVAFEPRTAGAIDDTRRIEVKVARPGAQVYTQRRHRLEPVAAANPPRPLSAGLKPTVDGALRGLLPVAARPLTLALAAFAGTSGEKARVLVNVDVGAFAGGGEPARALEFAVSAVDPTGRQVAFARQTATIVFGKDAAKPPDVTVQTYVDLPTGDYEIRVAVSDPATDVVASVFGAVVVPAFNRVPVSFSDFAVETTGLADAANQAISPRATTRRVFDRRERARAMLQIYQKPDRTDPLAALAVRTRIADVSGRVLRDQMMDVPAASFADRRVSLSLDLDRLPVGEHVLTVETTLDGHTARRALRFAVQ